MNSKFASYSNSELSEYMAAVGRLYWSAGEDFDRESLRIDGQAAGAEMSARGLW